MGQAIRDDINPTRPIRKPYDAGSWKHPEQTLLRYGDSSGAPMYITACINVVLVRRSVLLKPHHFQFTNTRSRVSKKFSSFSTRQVLATFSQD